MAELTTGDAARIHLEAMRMVLFAIVLELSDNRPDPVATLRLMERSTKRGVDASTMQPIGPFDGDVVKQIALEEIERFYATAIAYHSEQANRPQRD